MIGDEIVKKVILFDLDGTLVNSLQDLCDGVNYMLDKMGLPSRSLEEVRGFVGNGIDMLVRRSVGKNEFNFDEAMKYYREYYNDNLCNKTRPYEGMEKVLAELKTKGYKLGIVTNKAQWASEKIVDCLFKDVFDAVVGTDLEKRKKKPDPEPVDYALGLLGEERKSAVFVGDSEVDIATAKNAGLDFIGVTWGFRNREIFKDTEYIAQKTKDILSLCCNFL